MSTHRITPDTDIPFPCWLLNAATKHWFYASGGLLDKIDHLASGFTHYSTNPPDQRPEDVPSDKADAKPTPVQPDPSESLAKTLVGNLRAAFQEKDRAALDTLEIAWTAIIARHFEPLVREVEEQKRYTKTQHIDSWAKIQDALRLTYNDDPRSLVQQVLDVIAERDQLRAASEESDEITACLRAEVERLKQPWQVALHFPTPNEPFDRFECRAVDTGEADRIITVECPELHSDVAALRSRLAVAEELAGALERAAAALEATGGILHRASQHVPAKAIDSVKARTHPVAECRTLDAVIDGVQACYEGFNAATASLAKWKEGNK